MRKYAKRQRIDSDSEYEEEDQIDTQNGDEDDNDDLDQSLNSFIVDDSLPSNDVNEDIEENITKTSLKERFCSAMCSPEKIQSTQFFYDIVSKKLSPALSRGHKTDSKRLDKLVAFVYSGEIQQTKLLQSFDGKCNLCLLKRSLSHVISNGKNHYIVGPCCAENLINSRETVEKIEDMRKQVSSLLDSLYDSFNDMTKGLVEPVYQ